jgi:hypothetical protein
VYQGSAGHHGTVRESSSRGMPSEGSSTDVCTIRGVLLLLLIVQNVPELDFNVAGASLHGSAVLKKPWAERACLRSSTVENSTVVAWNYSLHDGQNGLRYSQSSNTMRDGPDSLLQRWLKKGAQAPQENEVVDTTNVIAAQAGIVTSAPQMQQVSDDLEEYSEKEQALLDSAAGVNVVSCPAHTCNGGPVACAICQQSALQAQATVTQSSCIVGACLFCVCELE